MNLPARSFPPSSTCLDPSAEELARLAVEGGQCRVTKHGALLLMTGRHTGRAPNDRFIVRDETTEAAVEWGPRNSGISPHHFAELRRWLRTYMATRKRYELNLHAGGPEGAPVRFTTTSAAHALFARHLFQAPRDGATESESIRLLHAPECFAAPSEHGTKSETFIVISPSDRTILIGGTGYAGEIKKSVFSLLNFLLPARGILPMHAAVNVGVREDSAVFFGLSGTGKTTLSADPQRDLLGDDEHGWSDAGLFNLEGGCYAKTVDLDAGSEPEIWRAVHRPLSLLENVTLDPRTLELDFRDRSVTENTRAAYPLSALERVSKHEVVRAPGNVIFLTADAFGVLPPVARLTPEQAVYYFLSGYTAKLAGTEGGEREPQPTFSTCFGSPFMPRPATHYAKLLKKRVEESGARVWLVNTGWIEGPYGEGRRMPIADTRRIVNAILNDELAGVAFTPEPAFGLAVPASVAGVRREILDVRSGSPDVVRYDERAKKLAERFAENFRTYAGAVSDAVREAGPRPAG